MTSPTVALNEGNLTLGLAFKERQLLFSPASWHKIIVHHAVNYERDFILKTIVDNIYPLDLVPVQFKTEFQNNSYISTFLARNCAAAIEKLCHQNLLVHNPADEDKPFKLIIEVAFSHTSQLRVNIDDNISSVLRKRYNSTTRTLNLENFYKDPELQEFCALSQPKILHFVLHLSKGFHIQQLKLQHNDIRMLAPIESILGSKLTVLDVRNNMIETMSELNILNKMHVTELWLHGNPVCDNYDEVTYVEAIKEVCPKIEKLDGVLLGQNGFLAFRRNFLCDSEGQSLIDQFLEFYYSLYDSLNRPALEAVYHKDAMFSLTCHLLSGHLSTPSAKLNAYKMCSRNIKMISDFSKSDLFLIKGHKPIIKILSELPQTEHDPYTFTVDLMHYTEDTAIFTVTGAFREPADNLLHAERVLGFTRTFVLVAISKSEVYSKYKEYNIVNEQLHVSNATTTLMQRAFKIPRFTKSAYATALKPQNAKEENDLTLAFSKMTTLNAEWARKCLEDCKFELEKALTMFVDLYKVEKIPPEAFMKKRRRSPISGKRSEERTFSPQPKVLNSVRNMNE